eukprot:TRINITY_DN602_c0_g1_i1.p1 TRINITY_DN602_c0_g1~~TRINITY_DN602_c0_g1_i1.p1  ORF type:complete len:195 (+),score=35.77 TRINITY_DN602_c0_g1_i1:78-587(+)
MTTEFQKVMLKRNANYFNAKQIINNIWLGSGNDAQNIEKLKENNISLIINVADDVPNYHEGEFEYVNLHVQDFGMDEGISRVFETVFQAVKAGVDEEKGILIHCAAGQNRSATVMIAVVMFLREVSLKEAYDIVIEKKRVNPLLDNRRELVKFELESRGENTLAEDEFY